MPRVNRIRVSNIKLDNGDKVFGDKIYKLYGKNSLFILENGGGKSSLIQLILQVVLPNYGIEGRKLKDSVKKDSTVHIAVEWLPDDENYGKFITGFSFHNYGGKMDGNTNKKLYDYFNYIIETDFGESPNLEELQFVKNGNVVSTEELRRNLKKRKGVQVCDSNSDYQDVIRQYGLVESEWGSIAKVNVEEGGVKEFFEKSETTSKLIKKLFIPSLLDSLFEKEEERNAILVAFKRYKDSLLELPRLEKDLNDFKVVTNHSEEVIDACEQYNQVLNTLNTSNRGLSRLYKTVQKSSETNMKWLHLAENELERMVEIKKDHEWKLDSYEIFLNKRKLDIQKNQLSDWEEQIETAKNEENFLDRKIREQVAAKLYEDYKTHTGNAVKAEGKLNVLSLANDQKSEALQKSRTIVSENYRYLINQNVQDQEGLKRDRNEQIRIEKEVKKSLDQLRSKKETLLTEKTQKEVLLSQYGSEKIKLEQDLLIVWENDLDSTENKILKKLEEKKTEESNLEEKLNQVDSELKILEQKKNECQNQINEIIRRTEANQKEFETFAALEGDLKNQVSAHLSIIIRDNLFDDRDRMVSELQKRKHVLETEIIKLSVEIGHLEQIKNSIEQRGYHVNSELEAVKDFLLKKGIDVVLGIDLLTKLSLPNELKKKLVKKNPLITFAIAIEDKQLSAIRKALEGYRKELSFPIFFIERAAMENQEVKEFIFLLGDNLHVFNQFRLRLNSSDWEEYIEELEKEITELNATKVELSSKNRLIHEFENHLKQFWNQYSSVTRITYSNQIKYGKNQIIDKNNELVTLKNDSKEKEEEKEKVKQSQKEIRRIITDLDKKGTRIQQFKERYVTVEQDRVRLNGVKGQIELLDQEINSASDTLVSCEDEKEKINGLLSQFDKTHTNLVRDQSEYRYHITEIERVATEEEYEKNKFEYNALRQEMSGEEERMEELLENIQNFHSSAKRAEEDITREGYTIESISRIGMVYDLLTLEQFELELSDVKDKINNLIVNKTNTQTEFDNINGSIKQLEKNLRESDYVETEPYEYGSSYDDEYKLFTLNLKLTADNIEKQTDKMKKTREFENENQVALDELSNSKEYMLDLFSANPFENEDWRMDKPIKLVRKYKKEIIDQREILLDKQIKAKKSIERLMEEVKKTSNQTIISMTRDLTRVLESTKDNYEQIISTFVQLLDQIKKFEESIEIQKKQTETGRDLLIDLMYERAELLHKNILEIQKSTQVEQAGKTVSYFRFRWPKKEDEDIKRQLREFVDGLLLHLTQLQDISVANEELEKEFERRADMINIVNCYADISRCRIEALKPRNELLVEKQEWEIWDRTKSWSNGELHATRMSMFIGFNSHLRKKRFSKENAWKFLLVDNPFGEASSDHVVKPMVVLAEKSNTQLFCFTGINDKGIQEEFDTVIHNKYIPQKGILFLDSRTEYRIDEDKDAALLEDLFYSKV